MLFQELFEKGTLKRLAFVYDFVQGFGELSQINTAPFAQRRHKRRNACRKIGLGVLIASTSFRTFANGPANLLCEPVGSARALTFAEEVAQESLFINRKGFGPYDYRTLPSDIKHRVEDYHFTKDVETLRKGATGVSPAGDLDYTLRAFPNSPRALLALSHLSTRLNTDRIPGMTFTTECFFTRGIEFVPNDPAPRLIYAIHLRDRKRVAEERVQLDEVERLRGDPVGFDLDYNLGLLYVELGEYDKGAAAAKRAYALGAPLPALMNKLRAKGKWIE